MRVEYCGILTECVIEEFVQFSERSFLFVSYLENGQFFSVDFFLEFSRISFSNYHLLFCQQYPTDAAKCRGGRSYRTNVEINYLSSRVVSGQQLPSRQAQSEELSAVLSNPFHTPEHIRCLVHLTIFRNEGSDIGRN